MFGAAKAASGFPIEGSQALWRMSLRKAKDGQIMDSDDPCLRRWWKEVIGRVNEIGFGQIPLGLSVHQPAADLRAGTMPPPFAFA